MITPLSNPLFFLKKTLHLSLAQRIVAQVADVGINNAILQLDGLVDFVP